MNTVVILTAYKPVLSVTERQQLFSIYCRTKSPGYITILKALGCASQ